jgi:hypothetical protein
MLLIVRLAVVFVIASSLVFIQSCSSATQTPQSNTSASQSEKGDKKKKGDKDTEQSEIANSNVSSAPPACDKTLWNHVYNPERLEVQKDCMAVTGTITERNTDDDGDEHMLLKLDEGQDDLLTKKNKKKKDDQLVIEAVCSARPQLKKAADACTNFSNSVPLPQVGDHVRVTGSLVIDTHNGWAEIHPISRIDKF